MNPAHLYYSIFLPVSLFVCLSLSSQRTQQLCADVSFLLHYTLATHPSGHRVCMCVCFLWSPSRCLSATLLIRQAEEKLSVFLLHQLQPLLLSCKQVPKTQNAKTSDKLTDTAWSLHFSSLVHHICSQLLTERTGRLFFSLLREVPFKK